MLIVTETVKTTRWQVHPGKY